jgi:hypothetical protein
MSRPAAAAAGLRWALASLRRIHRDLQPEGLGRVRLDAPDAIPESGLLGVRAALRLSRSRCLARSLVLQRWHAAHGRPMDMVIGVTGAHDFGAHAWLDDGATREGDGFTELLRHPA